MASAIAVLIPVLARPHRVAPLVENLAECSAVIDCLPVFIVSPSDVDEEAAVEKMIASDSPVVIVRTPFPIGPGNYARKINFGFEVLTKNTPREIDFFFMGADDLYFHPGWAERAIAAWYETGACVIGTNDMANPSVRAGHHSTHTLFHRSYIECGTIDEPGKLLHEGYSHNFVDNEFIATAQARETYYHASDVLVQHSHPLWGTAPMDDTYARGLQEHGEDSRLFAKRRSLWT